MELKNKKCIGTKDEEFIKMAEEIKARNMMLKQIAVDGLLNYIKSHKIS